MSPSRALAPTPRSPAAGPPRFNDTALDVTPDFPGIEDPTSVRHVEVTLTPTQGNKGTVEGEITTILCVDGEESENQLFITFEGTYKQTGGDVRFTGTFDITRASRGHRSEPRERLE